jgi:alpha-glucosidase
MKTITISFLIGCCCLAAYGETWTAVSPDGRIELTVRGDKEADYRVAVDGKMVIAPSPIGMRFDKGEIPGRETLIAGGAAASVAEEIRPVVPEKRAVIPDVYTALTLECAGGHGILFRVYNDAVAWRFRSAFDGPVKVLAETASFELPADCTIRRTSAKGFEMSFESAYTVQPVSEFVPGKLAFAPLMAETEAAALVITEADLDAYPGMFLTRHEKNKRRLTGVFAPYPEKEAPQADRYIRVRKRADYLAEGDGSRVWPWRVIAIAERQADLIENDIVFRLAPPLAIEDASWIKPGKVAWDWWNALNIHDVDFEAGTNIATWKYYLDFAARHGIAYIILDEGWSNTRDLFDRKIDLGELARYGKEKGVGLILWCVWSTLDAQLEKALADFEALGISGVKVDFMDRDDQKVVEFYHRLAKATAEHHLLLDFHGSYKPTGLRRAYPNLITREGVLGLEYSKWSDDSDPEYCVSIPFIRMLAGPMDYTPGAMNNAQKANFRPIMNRPMSMGTRCHQLAMFVVYESPLQMLCDTPNAYEANPDCLEFLKAVPTTWDETVALDGKAGEFAAVARRKDGVWYVGAMTNWDARDLKLALSFLEEGAWVADCYADGVNAHRIGIDYTREEQPVKAGDILDIHLAPGGGWAAKISPAP